MAGSNRRCSAAAQKRHPTAFHGFQRQGGRQGLHASGDCLDCPKAVRRDGAEELDPVAADCPVPKDQQPMRELKALQVRCVARHRRGLRVWRVCNPTTVLGFDAALASTRIV